MNAVFKEIADYIALKGPKVFLDFYIMFILVLYALRIFMVSSKVLK